MTKDEAVQRHGELVDLFFQRGLNAEESLELVSLRQWLELELDPAGKATVQALTQVRDSLRAHFVSGSAAGEVCLACRREYSGGEGEGPRPAVYYGPVPATHKLGEEIAHDDPFPNRHNFTAYVCCHHFRLILGDRAAQHHGCPE